MQHALAPFLSALLTIKFWSSMTYLSPSVPVIKKGDKASSILPSRSSLQEEKESQDSFVLISQVLQEVC